MSLRRRCSPRLAVIALLLWLLIALVFHLRQELAEPLDDALPGDSLSDVPGTDSERKVSAPVQSEAAVVEEPSKKLKLRNAFVVASQKTENTTWLREHFPEWEQYIYAVDDPTAPLTVPKNKGRESMVYLTFIIDNYDNLPDNVLFIHPTRYQWHNDDPDYDGLPMLRRFRTEYLQQEGYVNLRCAWVLGCPVEIRPFEDQHRKAVHAGDVYKLAFQELFPAWDVPEAVGVSCCAQFAATKETIRQRAKKDYEHYRDWIMNTQLEDAISGRVLEYSWHMIFGKEAVYCPEAKDCYCNVFGLCDLTCEENGSCEGRYVLPPYSSLPKGWPYVGWSNEPRNRSEPDS